MIDATRVRLLRYLARVPDACAGELADALRRSVPCVGMALLRLSRNGLIARTFDPRAGRHFYSITVKGRQRLRFWSEEAG